MKAISPLLTVCMTLFLLASSCSREDQPPPPAEKPKVVKRIVKPEPMIPEESRPAPEKMTPPMPPSPGEKVTTAPEEGEKAVPRTEPTEAPGAVEKDIRQYVVRKGESLTTIAGKEEVYGDPMKWTVLCRYAMDELIPLATEVDFPVRELPEGLRLEIVDPEERMRNLSERPGYNWAVNVQSAMDENDITPSAIRLVKEGYPAYLTRVKVKGKDWVRLRVGFFKTRAEADREGKKIMSLLNFDDLWVTKVGELEFAEFGGF